MHLLGSRRARAARAASARKIASISAPPSASSVSRRTPASTRLDPRDVEVSVPDHNIHDLEIYGIESAVRQPRGCDLRRVRAAFRAAVASLAPNSGGGRLARAPKTAAPSAQPWKRTVTNEIELRAPLVLGTKPTRTLTLNGGACHSRRRESGTLIVGFCLRSGELAEPCRQIRAFAADAAGREGLHRHVCGIADDLVADDAARRSVDFDPRVLFEPQCRSGRSSSSA